MKKMVTMSLVAAATTFAFASTADDIANLQKQIDQLKAKTSKINAHDAHDNIKWGVDFRTAYDNINYDMADGSSVGNDSLLSMRLWLNMVYSPDNRNIFKGQLSMNKAFGASFDSPMNRMFDGFDWTTNEALTDTTLKVRQAFWLYMGDDAFGKNIPWTFSIGRRPSTNGFLANLSQDDAAQSPLGHNINLEFDGLSSMISLSELTGVEGMSFKICMGQGSTNAVPLVGSATPNSDTEANGLDNIRLAGFIFVPYNDGQYIVKTTFFRGFDLPDLKNALDPLQGMEQVGNMDGAALSVLVDGVTEDGYFSNAKVFGSFAWSKSDPDNGKTMLGSADSETGTSYWFGTYLPVGEDADYGEIGLEYNHGSKYWRSFTYGEDTMIGSKLAVRGDAWEVNYTYQINDALSLQARYVSINHDYTGSNGFFGSTTGAAMKIDDIKRAAAAGNAQAQAMLPYIVEKAQDFRFYLRYRF